MYNNEQGINAWDSSTTYPVDAIVKGSDGAMYQAISEQSGNDPVTASEGWTRGIKGLVSSDPDGRYQIISATLVGDGASGTWSLAEDATRTNVGIASVTQNTSTIVLTLDQAVADAVSGADDMKRCSIVATTGPGMANSGVIASVNLHGSANGDKKLALVELFGDLEYIFDASSGTIVSTLNHFPSSVFSVSNSLGDRVQITHPSTGNNPGMPSVTKSNSGSNSNGRDATEDVMTECTGTNTSVYAVGPVDGRIYHDGTDWQYEGHVKTAPLMNWNSSSNTLTVTHDEASQYNINLTSRNPAVHCVVTSLSTIAFSVQFVDVASGAILETINLPSFDFYFTRKATAKRANLQGRYIVRSGKARIRPQDIGGLNQDIQIFGLVRSGAIDP